MTYNRDIHHRRSIRLRNYDYSQAGAYFVTICTYHRECLFGKITNRAMRLNDTGNIVTEQWIKTGEVRDTVELDAWTVMPNHFHGIIVITDAAVGAIHELPLQKSPKQMTRKQRRNMTLPKLIGRFKMLSSKHINILRNTPGTKRWQRNYWEHIIRNETELHRICEYIRNNPVRWQEDALHPDQPPFPGETRESSPPYGDEVWMV